MIPIDDENLKKERELKTKKMQEIEQPRIDNVYQAKKLLQISQKEIKTIDEKIVWMICLDNQPNNIVENKGFSELINYLKPGYKMPSRKTISKDIIPSMYEFEKKINWEFYVK